MKNKRNLKLNKASIRLVIELLLITVSIFVLTNTSGANYVFNSLMAGAEGELFAEDNESLTAAAAVTIDTMEKLVNYANNYTGANQYDTITINIIQDTAGMDSFTGIGTSGAPFGGTLTVSSPLTLDTPLFNYVYDSASISSMTIIRTKEVDAPLLAANVVHGGNNTEETAWTVTNNKYYDSNGVEQLHPYAGVIGTIGADAEVNLTINNNATNIKSAGDVGLACQTMGKGSTLKVNVVSAAYSVDAGRYAGGLVGSAENAKVILGDGVSISSTVKGTSGSGGIFGYYKNDITGVSDPIDAGNVIDISSYNVNCSLNGTIAGGFIGVLENEGDMTVKADVSGVGTPVITSSCVSENGVYGGIIGAYSSNSLSHSLTIKDIADGVVNATNSGNTDTNYAHYFGGIIGKVTDCAAYVKMDNVSVTAAGSTKIKNESGKAFGGLVGYINGAFIDANNVTISSDNFYGGGIIGTMDAGVLRLSGTTDLSAAQVSSDNKNIVRGQIVGKRGNQALVYAKAGWQLIRSTAVAVDDIGTWGEVLRFGTLAESDVLDVDDTQHTVTVKAANTSVGSLADFAKLALNIRMNSGTTISTGNALCFNSSSLSSTLLTSDITLSANIDLTGTGITGLTRDDGNNSEYKGTFNGGGHTITLATGEPYGYRGNDTTPVTETESGNGNIHRHHYNGLFAKVGDGATFKNLTVAGKINGYFVEGNKYYCGGLAAYCMLGTFAAENVTSDVTIRYNSSPGDYHLLGGFIGGTEGKTSDSSITLSFTNGCCVNTTIDDKSTNNNNGKLICGGIIGDLATAKNVSVTVDDLTLSAKVSNNSRSDGKKIGGLIGNISNYGNDDPGKRVMTLTRITVDGTEVKTNSNVDNNNNIKGGALLGEAWNNMNVTIGSETDSGITVKSGTVIQSGNGDMAGLVTAATGYWKVYDIKIQSLTATGANVRSFGLLINKGIFNDYSREFALYLEFEKENAYQITSSGINLDGLNANAVFDEILTTCSGRYDTTNTVLESNKCAVVSIHTSGDTLIMNGTDCNTYQNQTGRLISNPNTRYYYNLDFIRAKPSPSDAEKLLLWSVETYAYSGAKSSIKSYFGGHNFGNTIPEATYDMTGYSYYPVDSSGVTVSGGCTFKFCNTEIESGENQRDVGDGLPRSTADSSSQHYLMHFGLFRNVSGNLAVNSSISLSGSVGNSVEYCGALVCGQLTGTGNEINGVELNGIKVNGIDTNPDYAPLLVNTIPTEAAVTFSNIRAAAAAYSAGSAAATSLIGNVGGASADHINITFSNIVLDGRKAANTLTALDTAYKTTKSIFTNAALLNSFVYTSGKSCTAVYNYTHAEDWEEPLHQVTYGAEIISSTEYAGKQEYYVDAEKYTNPENSNGDRYTAFANDYLPYVATAYNAANNLHEIKVNHKKAADLNVGCGTYNDPYIITTGSQLALVADILGGTKPEKDVEINYKAGNYNAWCDGKNSHTTYTWDGSTSWKSSDPSTMSLDDMAKALATAYYMIDNDSINLSVSFVGIGKSTPFKGVIVGNNKDAEGNSRIPIIVSKSTSPLIYNSTGSVIKDLTINVAADFSNSLKGDANATYITDGGTTEFYGGVFGIVNGGDNIIDNVSVNFIDFEDSEGNSVNSASTININSGSNPGNKAVGGYIGVVRYGGVFFRNMKTDSRNYLGITATDNSMFNSTGDFKDANNKIWLYCNPIIGRVIDGFAVTETGAYNGDAATVTMQNGTKNYSITDIKQSADRIDFDNFTTGKTSSINAGTVKISDAQQLFILGCISMSGAGSAPLGGEYGTSYSYGNNQMTRHADYSAVGTNNTKDETTDFASSSTDSFSKNTVPYIIYHYTDVSANNNKNGVVQFPARSITNNNCVFNINLTQGTYELPAGFRGIGSLNNSSDDLKMYINGIQGNNSKIVLNMSFNAYKKNYDQYYTTNGNINENCVGLGLFNSLSQNNSNVTNSGDIDTEECAICNLTISGSINYEIYDYDNKNNIILAGRDNIYYCCSGGLAGTANAKSGQSNIRLKNVKTENLTINARHIVGGLIGFARNGTVRMENCDSDNLTITKNANANVGAVNAGGLIGYVNGCGVDIIGGTYQAINITTGEQAKGWSGNEGIAGLIGCMDCNGKTITVDGANITNISIDTRGSGFFAGSVLGCCKNGLLFDVKNVAATDVNINKNNDRTDYCGGLIGGTKTDVKNFLLSNSRVKCTDNETANRGIINGATISGGILGYCGSNLTMDNCSIENYDLRSTTNSKYSDGVGALVAKAEGEKTVIIKNSKASDCALTAVKASGDSYKPMGRIIGSAYEKAKVYGYNIVLDNVKMQLTDGNSIAGNDTYIGDIIGELRNTNANNVAIDVNFVGVSMTRDEGGKYVGKNLGRSVNNDKGICRVIYSDYNGTCLSELPNIEASSVNSTNNVTDMGASPYATVNPRTDIGHSTDTMFLTGDGAAAYESTAAKIISDVKTNATYSYKNISADVTKFSAFESKMSTFKTKTANADISKDFPVLVINDSNYQKITDMINSYIHILTNDSSITNYADDNNSIYNVEFTTYRLENNSHRFVTSEEFLPTLMRDTNGCFKMTDKDYDSSHEQFTLIDIQYFAPNDTSKIAYHLYIPVYVEKMLKFNFKAGALSGTTYNADFYENGMPIMENYGTPVTSHITYSYLRTEEEWANAINNGENLLKAYGKTITVTKNTIPNDTQLVLVDKNNNGMAYYSTFSSAVSAYNDDDNKLNFNCFTSSDNKPFEPVPFIDLLSVSANITANADANGTLAKCDAADANATVRIGEQYYRLAESSDTEKYSVTVAAKDSSYLNGDVLKVDEEYYLSIFTKEDNAANIMKTKISCAFRLDDDGMIPSHLNNNGATECSVYIVLGNLYDQSLTFITDSIQGGGKIFTDPQNPNNSNNKIKAELKTIISLKSRDVVDYLKSDLIHLYHGFIIEATITDPNGSEKGIKGSPRVTGTYMVESNSYPQNIHNAEMSVVLCGNVNDTLVDIKSGLINGDSVTISCTDLMIDYPDDASIIAQFPQRSLNDTTTGVTYSASSNLAYVADNIENSSMSVTMNDGILYYRENISSASLSYNVPAITANDLTILGINGREANDNVNAAAYYNVKNIPETDMNKAAFVKLRLELYRKGNDGGYTQVDIKEHLNGVCIYYALGGAQKKGYFADDTGGAYALTIKKAEIDLYDDGLYEIETNFDVKTGVEFENGNLTYANYKIKLTAELLDENGVYIENTNCSDYIIYTNAKICTDMLAAS